MPSLGESVARLAAFRAGRSGAVGPERLVRLADFGSNPGELEAFCHVPARLGSGAPLVVVLHGCTQTAAEYDAGSGWSALAERAGFAVLYAEQRRANNPNVCFNWFVPDDVRRGSGEVASIAQMVSAMQGLHGLEPRRTFVTGLSAGGAMAMAMLATYPERFAAGAVLAGVPFGAAGTVQDALERMRGKGLPGAERLADAVRRASPHEGPWPRLSVWQGTSDMRVDAANAEAIAASWAMLHGASAAPQEGVNGHHRRVWSDASGREVVEAFSITGMGHGLPLSEYGAEAWGRAGPHMLEAGISSTRRIAAFWGLAPPLQDSVSDPARASAPAGNGAEFFINQALRQAGLLR